MASLKDAVFTIGDWTVDPKKHQLIKNVEVVAVQPKTMDVLVFLAEHGNNVMSSEQILQGVWGDTVVADESIYTRISQLRGHLADDPKAPTYIQTVTSRGYRLIADVTVPPRAVETKERNQGKAGRWIGGGLAAVMVMFLAVWLLPSAQLAEAIPNAKVARDGPRDFHIAVLRFDNQTGDAAVQQFADAMVEETIDELTNVCCFQEKDGFDVVAFTESFRFQSHTDVQEVAHALDASYIVKGNIQQDNDALVIKAYLIRTFDRAQVRSWAYERPGEGDVATLHEVAELAAHDVLRAMNSEFFKVWLGVDTQFQEAVRAWYDTGMANSKEGKIRYLQQAIDADPTWVRPHTKLAQIYLNWGELENASLSVARALELADDGSIVASNPGNTTARVRYADAYRLAARLARRQGDFPAERRHLEHSLAIRPISGAGNAEMASLEMRLGNLREALEFRRRAAVFHPNAFAQYASVLHAVGRNNQALMQINQAIYRNRGGPGDPYHFRLKGEILLKLGRRTEAEVAVNAGSALVQERRSQRRVPDFSYIYVLAKLGREDEARQLLRSHYEIYEAFDQFDRYVAAGLYQYSYWAFITGHVGLGEPDEAIEWMLKAVEHNDQDVQPRDPTYFSGLYDHPRWSEVMTTLEAQEKRYAGSTSSWDPTFP